MYQEQRQEATMVQRFAERLDELLWRKDFEFCELVSGLGALIWGVILVMPWDTFGSSPGFALLDAYVPEWLGGLFMLWVGVTQIGALFLEHYRVRRIASILVTGLWMALAVILWAGNFQGVGYGLHVLLALCSGWAHLRIGRTAA